jgi:N-acyl-D-amino-acid deacylase
VLSASGAGVMQGVGGPGLGIPEFAAIAKRSKQPVTWCSLHQGVSGGKHWELAKATTDAREAGADIWAQMGCVPIVGQFTLHNPYVLNGVPAFGKIDTLSKAEKLPILSDPVWQAEAERQVAENREQLTYAIRWDRIKVMESERHPDLVGKTIPEIVRPGQSPLGAMVELARSEDLKTRFNLIMFNYDDDDVGKLLRERCVLLGLGDGGAHASQMCDASFPLHLLGHFVRKRKDFSLEFGVWRVTGHPAKVFGIPERGEIRQGYYADISVFDPETIDEAPGRRVHDFPAGADRILKDPIGVDHVMVNGNFIRRDGKSRTGVAGGRVLRR